MLKTRRMRMASWTALLLAGINCKNEMAAVQHPAVALLSGRQVLKDALYGAGYGTIFGDRS